MMPKKTGSKKKSTSNRKKTRREIKQKAVDYKGGGCEICGYSRSLAALTFHHRNPLEKDFGISDLMSSITWKKLKKELDRCFLLCCRCHIEVHQGLIDGYIDVEPY